MKGWLEHPRQFCNPCQIKVAHPVFALYSVVLPDGDRFHGAIPCATDPQWTGGKMSNSARPCGPKRPISRPKTRSVCESSWGWRRSCGDPGSAHGNHWVGGTQNDDQHALHYGMFLADLEDSLPQKNCSRLRRRCRSRKRAVAQYRHQLSQCLARQHRLLQIRHLMKDAATTDLLFAGRALDSQQNGVLGKGHKVTQIRVRQMIPQALEHPPDAREKIRTRGAIVRNCADAIIF